MYTNCDHVLRFRGMYISKRKQRNIEQKIKYLDTTMTHKATLTCHICSTDTSIKEPCRV